MSYSLSSKFLYADIMEPVFTRMIKMDFIFLNKDMMRFSTVRIDDSWKKYHEILNEKYVGFVLSKNMKTLEDKTDFQISMDRLIGLLKSTDLDEYHKVKH